MVHIAIPAILVVVGRCLAEPVPTCQPRHAWTASGGYGRIAVDTQGNVFSTGLISRNSPPYDDDIGILAMTNAGKSGWNVRLGGENDDYGKAIIVGSDDHVLVASSFGGLVDFDPGPGVDEHQAPPDHYTLRNAALTKFTAQGDYLWTRSFGWSGFSSVFPNSIALLDQDDFVVVGRFGGMIDFDPGPQEAFLSSDDAEMYVARLTSEGELRWVRNFGGPAASSLLEVGTDDLGIIYATGVFRSRVDFDPGPGVVHRSVVNFRDNVFVNMLDSDGNFVRVITYPIGEIAEMAVPPAGGFVLTGPFLGTVDFDPTAGVDNRTAIPYLPHPEATADLFVTRVGPGGEYLWTYSVGTPDIEYGAWATFDPSGDILVSVYFSSNTIDLDAGPGVAELHCQYGCFALLRLSGDGTFRSAINLGPTTASEFPIVTTDADGNIFYSRYIGEPADVDPTCEELILSRTPIITKLTCDPRTADFDSDGDLDLADLAAFQNCFEGFGATTCNPGCDEFDLIPDNAIDAADFAIILPLLTGP